MPRSQCCLPGACRYAKYLSIIFLFDPYNNNLLCNYRLCLIISISYEEKGIQKVMQHVQSHTGSTWQSWNLNLCGSDSRAHAVTPALYSLSYF